ncbi:MAG: ABC transporter ATP-binding protein [Thermoanaerobaculia bacterium]|nr:ABC transporter ATP-binding protein [Thermoanaerobaculia bacterium]
MTLRAVNISKAYNGVKALDEVSLDFAAHGVTAIIGPNGAGKTTLIDVLTGFQRSDSGTTYLGGLEITRLPPARIARLGIVRTFQEVQTVWRESVLENVMVAVSSRREQLLRSLAPRGRRKEEERIRSHALEAIRLVGLVDRIGDTASELSYGQRKLLTLARCFAANPKWLVLDEPVSGVSPVMARDILRAIRTITDRGHVVVMIEHNMLAVREVANAVVVLDRGKVIASGNAADVLGRKDVLEAYLA